MGVCGCVGAQAQAQFNSMEIRNKHFTAFVDSFTSNTYVMVIMSDPRIGTWIAAGIVAGM